MKEKQKKNFKKLSEKIFRNNGMILTNASSLPGLNFFVVLADHHMKSEARMITSCRCKLEILSLQKKLQRLTDLPEIEPLPKTILRFRT